MKRTPIRLLPIIFCLVIAILLVRGADAQQAHPDLTSGKRQVKQVVVMPVYAAITKDNAVWNGRFDEAASNDAIKTLGPMLAAAFRNINCTVHDSEEFTDKAEPPAVVQLMRQYMNAKDLFKHPKDVRAGRVQLSPLAAHIPGAEQADALVFLRAYGRIQTGGGRFANLGNGNVRDELDLEIAVLDAKNGDVLFYVTISVHENLAKDTDKARAALEKALSTFPKAGGVASGAVLDKAVALAAPTRRL